MYRTSAAHRDYIGDTCVGPGYECCCTRALVNGSAGDTKNKNGKLRLLYECAPMSFLAEQAGGLGSTGTRRVLDIVPEAIHQRVPLYIGSKKEVRHKALTMRCYANLQQIGTHLY
jgi:hypothetical protein